MGKKRRHRPQPGAAPATLVSPIGARAGQPIITLIEFDATHFEERVIEKIEDLWHCRESPRTSWINIDGLGDVETLRKLGVFFGFHPLALEDTLNVGQRPKVEEFDDHFFIVGQMVFCREGFEMDFEQISIFLKSNVIITIQEEDEHDAFEPLRERLRAGRGFARTRSHDYLAYALLDAIQDHFFPVLEQLGEEMERMEEALLDKPRKEAAMQLHALKRVLIKLRRFAWPQREVFATLLRDERLIKEETKLFMRDGYDHAIQIMDMVESYRDVAAGLMDFYLSSLGHRTNEIMRVLTVISAIFIPLTFIAGVYGMNFENMPELKWHWGYFGVVGLMLATGGGMLIYFKRKNWF